MVLFTDQAKTSIDEKGRTSFPREFRRQLPEEEGRKLVVTRGPGRTLELYTKSDFRAYAEKLLARENTPRNTIFRQQVLGGAQEVELDGQNRMMLSKNLLAFADLTDEVVFVGDGRKIVMWKPEEYEKAIGFATAESYALFDQAYYDFSSDKAGDNG